MCEEKLGELAKKSVGAMVVVILFSVCFSKYHDITLYASTEAHNMEKEAVEKMHSSISYEELTAQMDGTSLVTYTDAITGAATEDIGSCFLKLEKTQSNGRVSLQDLYMERSIRVTIEGLFEKSYTKQDIIVSQDADGLVEKVSLTYEYNPDTFLYTAVFEIEFGSIYAYNIYETKKGIYVTIKDPHEVYDKIIVVDAGHGGNDTGTYTDDMKYFEKDINLSVILYLKELLDSEDSLRVYYTRLSDEKVYLNPRLNLANALNADLFISVHCNSSEYESASGSEVLYRAKDKKKASITSKRFASICLEEVAKSFGTRNRGLVKGNEIYIVDNAKVPVALIELGFMSNESDLDLLISETGRKKAAQGISNAIKKALNVLEE